jgi:hypothetical protein
VTGDDPVGRLFDAEERLAERMPARDLASVMRSMVSERSVPMPWIFTRRWNADGVVSTYAGLSRTTFKKSRRIALAPFASKG